MTPNDVQIDVLMRRYAKNIRGAVSPGHLDADELNAFAEGSLPPAARARYVSHLADCDNCRQLVSQLAMTAGAMARTEALGATDGERVSWSQRLAAFFAPRSLRYAAFAVVLIAAAGVVFLVVRRPANNPALVAQNEQGNQTASSAVKPGQVAPQASADDTARRDANRNAETRESPQSGKDSGARDESRLADSSVPAPKPTAETSSVISPPMAAKKSAEPAITESRPSYAPPPPGESQAGEERSRPKQSVGGLASGPRKTDSSDDKFKTMDRVAAPTSSKDRAADESNRAGNQSVQNNRVATQEKRGGPRRSQENRSQENIATTNQIQVEAQKKESSGVAANTEADAAPETRSVGGRKFRKQGNAWVDFKFKSSMSLKSIARGSEEFSSLDSGLRSIASQLAGEIIVVWKSKAYRIR